MSVGDKIRRVGQCHGGEGKVEELYLYEHAVASGRDVYHDKAG